MLFIVNSYFIRFAEYKSTHKPIAKKFLKNIEFFLPGGDLKYFGEVKSHCWRDLKNTRLSLVSNDSEDIISYLSIIHFDAVSGSENKLL